jgi:hypothetical protein
MSGSAKPDVTAIGLPGKRVGNLVVREAAVSAAAAGKNQGACPVCGSTSVLLEGQFRREFVEEVVEGKSNGYNLSSEMQKNILSINCLACQVRYVIEPNAMFSLREEIVELQMELGKRDGLAVVEPATEQVM